MAGDRSDHLRQALGEVDAVLSTLNTNRTICPCCGLTKYENLDDARAHEELTGVANRLRKHIGIFGRETS